MALSVTPDEAYAEACTALGEAVVAQRLLAARLTAVEFELAVLKAPAENTEAGS